MSQQIKETVSPIVRSTYEKLMENKTIQETLKFIESDHRRTVEEQIAITEIPAPPFKEEVRARNVKKRLEDLSLSDVRMDKEGNVYGVKHGTGYGPKIFISAHLDTVFPEGTDVGVAKKGRILSAPGISDDTRGLAELLAAIRAVNQTNLPIIGDVVFGATVGEEGAGDLRGVKAFFDENKDIDGFISIDGPDVSSIIYLGTGSYRYTIIFKGDGGHSFGAFGIPSATHALGRAIAAISDFKTKEDPKTTFTVGEVWGGTSVNAIAAEAGMTVDLRSNDQTELKQLEEELLRVIHESVEAENARWESNRLTVEINRFGNRPPASQPSEAPIVEAAFGAIEKIVGKPSLVGAVSTDANHPMSLGIPSITIGLGGKSGGTHTLDEWYDPTEAYIGIQKNFLTILGLVGVEGVCEPLLGRREDT
ncbi:Acetylornithine deacetylase/Succinyl-diaminopimelate desuccinylase [Lentibacillus halodurans]|uniref:Acetylornithine deacetylase/Succinyl-diaminopimelate desuccinylase n=1 Tax=Lentibacillus halodurans TaxID=237679 RepID=A0A1I0YCK9_9BACI|nr:M20/M25/M40 family metallo-hydrolase [Lentibacillus halodurans]SFB10537.1 Acetylornithine deacetylase/Succinyl-diaminopimelate desuccinylase [Lentibacillus halodurans]